LLAFNSWNDSTTKKAPLPFKLCIGDVGVSWNYRTSGILWNIAGGNWYDKNGDVQGSTPYVSVTFPAGKVPDDQYYDLDVTQLV